ncbi:MAG: restriction endonuclease subunit S [Alteromonadaceae bacterium]|jgi:restriction endonuclease S subunit
MTNEKSIIIRSGYTFRETIQFDPNGNHYLIQIKNIIKDGLGKKIDVLNLEKINSPTDNSNFYVKDGDILILKKGDDHNAYMVNNAPEATLVGQNFLIISTSDEEKLPSEFLVFFINLPSTQLFLSSLSGGGKQASLGKAALEKLKIPILTKEEQAELMILANEISKEKVILEQLIYNRERQLQKLIELKTEGQCSE